MARIDNAIKNIVISVTSQIVKLLAMFVARTVFIYTIGINYLGLDSVFANILTLLSLSEMGIGTAIIFSMYKPVASEDKDQITAILLFYKKIYMIIGFTILGLGACFIPFLNTIISLPENVSVNIYLVYSLFLLNTVSGYFLAYKRAVITAHQKSFVESINKTIFIFILSVAQIIVLITTKNYILYLVCVICCTVLENISISIVANKMFPYITKKANKLDKITKKGIYKNALAMFMSKISSTIVLGTSNIIISLFLGLTMVGKYSNYVFIITAIATFLGFFLMSITASVGNLLATENERGYDVFVKLRYLFMIINGFASICLFVLLSSFVSVWAGSENVLSIWVVGALVLNNFITNERGFIRVFKQASGHFWNDKYVFLLEAALNILLSLAGVHFFGIFGVVLGILVSSCLTGFIAEPYVTYKHCFKKPLKKYFFSFLYYFLIILAIGTVVWFVCLYLPMGNIGFFILKLSVCVILTAILLLAAFFTNPNFNYYKTFFKKIFSIKKIVGAENKAPNLQKTNDENEDNLDLTDNDDNNNLMQ